MCGTRHLSESERRLRSTRVRRQRRTVFRRSRLVVTVALVIVLLTQIPSMSPPGSVPPALPTGPALTFRTDATAAEILEAGAQLLESYGA